MLTVGNTVTVKAPFNEAFPLAYAITEVVHSGDGTVTYILGDCGGFDAIYLELAV
jgi:hypothetical protein